MRLMMITLLTLGSAVGQVFAGEPGSAPVAEEYYDDCYEPGVGRGRLHSHMHYKHAVRDTSPQTCYSPRFGCYHSNERHMNRYPAFHGTFYRNSYNYRNYFDYPWHAQPHEPTSLFSHNVGEDQPEPQAPAAPPQARRQPVRPNESRTPTPAAANSPTPAARTTLSTKPKTASLPASSVRQVSTSETSSSRRTATQAGAELSENP